MVTDAPGPTAAALERLAGPALAYGARLAEVEGEETGDLLRHAGRLLDRFAADAARAGLVASAIPPARYALALILDTRARANRALDLGIWSAGAHRLLFDGREISVATLRDFARKAEGAGPEFAAVAGFLASVVARLEGQRRQYEAQRSVRPVRIVALLVAGFVVAVMAWAAFVEWRFHRDLSRVFAEEALQIGLERDGAFPDLAPRLDQLAAAAERVKAERARAPVSVFAGLFGFDAATRAEALYLAAVARHVPAALARGVDLAIATEGDPEALYDTLRAWSILSGQAPWAPAYLAGWAGDQGALSGLAVHAARLAPPIGALPQPDPELLAQAGTFARTADEAERAYLELRRSAAVAGLAPWRPDVAVEGLGDVMQRRSGLPIGTPIAGIHTAQGWDYARAEGAGLAVQTTRSEAARLFAGAEPLARNDAPDLVMDILQRETLGAWRALLDDLRVRAFADRSVAVLVSGRLATAQSPLERLIQAVWAEAGGRDRNRSYRQQLLVAAEFAAMIQYVEQGGMAQISALFAGLNVALGAADRNGERGQRRLMSVQDQARSVAALRVAPRVVVQIVEDTLAQTGAAHQDVLSNPLTRAWQTEALSACVSATQGRFPFAPGPDADPRAVEQALAPGGAVDRFFRTRAAPLLDTSEVPWRWKPEARFAGLSPGSALFFQRAAGVRAGLFGPDGRLGTTLSLTALAERGRSTITIGGEGGPVEAGTESLSLVWPGAAPDAGIDVRFQTPEGDARLAESGVWGLLRLLAPLRLRERDEGKRLLLDLRSEGARLFLEIGFAGAANPVSLRGVLKAFTCPPVL